MMCQNGFWGKVEVLSSPLLSSVWLTFDSQTNSLTEWSNSMRFFCMLTPAFTKLQRSIVTSSIWLQDADTRLVWITLLALCDRDGVVRASPLGLAHQARVEPEACHRALELLQSPDADSRSTEHEGRRIERVDGGFMVLNYQRILSEGAREERREYNREKQAEFRAKKRANGKTVRPEHRDDQCSEGPLKKKRNGVSWDGLGGQQYDGKRTLGQPEELA